MFGEISLWVWMGGAIMFAIGGAAGFFISRQLKDKRTLELEDKLAATRTELADYRGEVNQHFLKTSLLVSKLTNDYREVYEHLATGAQKLCNDKPGTPKLDLPDTKILPTAEAAAEAIDTDRPPIEQASDTAEISSETGIEARETEHIEKIQPESPADVKEESESVPMESSTEETVEEVSAQEAGQPAPEDIPDRDEGDEEVPLGAESAPSVDTDLQKTHPAIH